jgi:hypothetical protein
MRRIVLLKRVECSAKSVNDSPVPKRQSGDEFTGELNTYVCEQFHEYSTKFKIVPRHVSSYQTKLSDEIPGIKNLVTLSFRQIAFRCIYLVRTFKNLWVSGNFACKEIKFLDVFACVYANIYVYEYAYVYVYLYLYV